MAGRKRTLPNPLYVLLLLVSTAFVLTALGYLMGPFLQQRADEGRGPDPGGLALWLDRHGPLALGVEFLLMLVCGIGAMLVDRWFPSKPLASGGRSSAES